MTEQTPKERLEYEMRCIGLGDVPDSPMFERVRSAAIAYIKHAEARIKELEADADEYKDVIKTANQTALDYMDKYKKAQAKLKAWEDAPTITVMEGSFLAERWLANPGVYHLKPTEADDAQGN